MTPCEMGAIRDMGVEISQVPYQVILTKIPPLGHHLMPHGLHSISTVLIFHLYNSVNLKSILSQNLLRGRISRNIYPHVSHRPHTSTPRKFTYKQQPVYAH